MYYITDRSLPGEMKIDMKCYFIKGPVRRARKVEGGIFFVSICKF